MGTRNGTRDDGVKSRGWGRGGAVGGRRRKHFECYCHPWSQGWQSIGGLSGMTDCAKVVYSSFFFCVRLDFRMSMSY